MSCDWDGMGQWPMDRRTNTRTNRMVEDGHFPELTRLLGSLVAQGKTYQKDYDEIRRGARR